MMAADTHRCPDSSMSNRNDFADIVDTALIVRSKELKRWGEERTKRLALAAYDRLAEATASGTPYQTPLDPPPADPRVAHSWPGTVAPH